MPIGGTLKSLQIDLSSAPGAGQTVEIAVSVNGVDSALKVTITGTNKSGLDSTHTVTVSAGDRVQLHLTTSSTVTTGTVASCIVFDSGSLQCILGGFLLGSASASAQNYIGLAVTTPTSVASFASSLTFTESMPCPIAGSITDFRVSFLRAPGAGKQFDFYIYKNGSQEATSKLTISGTNLTGSVSGLSIAVAEGDTLTFSTIPTGTPATFLGISWGVAITPTTAGQFPITGGSTGFPTTVTEWSPLFKGDYNNDISGSPETVAGGAQSNSIAFQMSHLRVAVATAPGAGGSGKAITITSRRNAGAGALSATITETATTASDLSNSQSYQAADLADWQCAPTSTPTSSAIWVVAIGSTGVTPSFSSAPAVTYGGLTRTGPNNTPWTLTFTPSDTGMTGTNALNWKVYTGAGRTGTLVASGTCTNAVQKVTTIAYNASGLSTGSQTLYVSLDDGTLTSADSTVTLLRDDGAPTASTSISVAAV
jgi:hypothetical protein